MTIREVGPAFVKGTKPLTEREWTRITPWTVATAPLDGDIITVLDFTVQDDALRCVQGHNAMLHELATLRGFGPKAS